MTDRFAMSRGHGVPDRAWYRRRSVWISVALMLSLSSVGIAWSERAALLTAAGRWLDVGERLHEPVDCVYILGGDADTRPFAAAALIRKGWARRALIPTNATETHEPTHHSLLREILRRRGVAAQNIVDLPGEVTSTRDEVLALRRYLQEHSVRSVAVITSDYHTRRARAIFQRQLGGGKTELYFISAPTERFHAADWWQHEQGWKMYLGEYVKLAYGLVQ
jgi:uncharacterized SAM-binding protein YcdF (DUF218 family)